MSARAACASLVVLLTVGLAVAAAPQAGSVDVAASSHGTTTDNALPKLEEVSKAVNHATAGAQLDAAKAGGFDAHQEAMDEFQSALRARGLARRLRAEGIEDKKHAKKVMSDALTLAKKANKAIAQKDVAVLRQRQASLDDLKKALEIESENRDNNAKIEELRNKLARAKDGKRVAKQEVKEANAKAKAKVEKADSAVKSMSTKMDGALKKQAEMAKKLGKEKKREDKNMEEMTAQKAHKDLLALQEKGKAKAAEEKQEAIAAKKAEKKQEELVKAGKKLYKDAKNDVKTSKVKATAAVKEAAAEKDTTTKGLVKAQVAANALKRVRKLQDVAAAVKNKLNTEVAALTLTKIDSRFLKLKHESRAQAHLESLNRAKKRSAEAAKAKEKREKKNGKAKAKAKLSKLKVKAKKKLKREKLKAKEEEKKELSKAKSKNKALKAAEKTLEDAGAAAEKQAKAKKIQASKEKSQKESDKKMYVKKAKVAISNQWDKDYTPGIEVSLLTSE